MVLLLYILACVFGVISSLRACTLAYNIVYTLVYIYFAWYLLVFVCVILPSAHRALRGIWGIVRILCVLCVSRVLEIVWYWIC
jgi:hypothetical protein